MIDIKIIVENKSTNTRLEAWLGMLSEEIQNSVRAVGWWASEDRNIVITRKEK